MNLFFIFPPGCVLNGIERACTNDDVTLQVPEECTTHRELVGKAHEHRYFDYRNDNQDGTLIDVHELDASHSVGFENWFRFRLPEADRLSESSEFTDIVLDTNEVWIMFFISFS